MHASGIQSLRFNHDMGEQYLCTFTILCLKACKITNTLSSDIQCFQLIQSMLKHTAWFASSVCPVTIFQPCLPLQAWTVTTAVYVSWNKKNRNLKAAVAAPNSKQINSCILRFVCISLTLFWRKPCKKSGSRPLSPAWERKRVSSFLTAHQHN